MTNKIVNIFKQEPYPSYPEDWDSPENTVFREFYLKSSPDFAILQRLVAEHMSDKGNEGITRHRLMHILRDCENRAFYLHAQKREYPYTWNLRWKWRCLKLFLHRRFKTRYFRNQVELCTIATDVVARIKNNAEIVR